MDLSAHLVLPLVALALTFASTSAAVPSSRTTPCCMPDSFSITVYNMGDERWDLAIRDFTHGKVIAYVLGQEGDYIFMDEVAGKRYTRLNGKCIVTDLPNKQYIPHCIDQNATLVYEAPDVAAWEVDNADVKETWVMSKDKCFPMAARLEDKKNGINKLLSFADPTEITVPQKLFDVDISDCVEA